VRGLLASGTEIAGFGHPLYPGGDVRAAAILSGLYCRQPRLADLVDTVFDLTGRRPSLDFALVALRRTLGLPDGAAFGLFALGRSVGWIAQALEQRDSGSLIRPRAAYTGPRP
jgi:citrate synthase